MITPTPISSSLKYRMSQPEGHDWKGCKLGEKKTMKEVLQENPWDKTLAEFRSIMGDGWELIVDVAAIAARLRKNIEINGGKHNYKYPEHDHSFQFRGIYLGRAQRGPYTGGPVASVIEEVRHMDADVIEGLNEACAHRWTLTMGKDGEKFFGQNERWRVELSEETGVTIYMNPKGDEIWQGIVNSSCAYYPNDYDIRAIFDNCEPQVTDQGRALYEKNYSVTSVALKEL